jgi:hypothetical protein
MPSSDRWGIGGDSPGSWFEMAGLARSRGHALVNKHNSSLKNLPSVKTLGDEDSEEYQGLHLQDILLTQS